MADLGFYVERFGYCDRQIDVSPDPDLGLVVVIPCHNEPDLCGSLEALRQCTAATRPVEVLVVINESENACEEIRERNRSTYNEAIAWERDRRPAFKLHLIRAEPLPKKHAGVGLARKIGMDEAIRRLDEIGRLDEGVIICFDADCRCDRNYLVEVGRHFSANPNSPACSIRFEHPLEGELDAEIYDAIIDYELHLRYFIEACRYAGHPHAYHTIGSSMAIRPSVYIDQGGMNRRKAGEDFYFLQKIIPLGGFTELNTTRVIPSPRPSDRVPFGTGRAVGEAISSGKMMQTYPLEPFLQLREFIGRFDRVGLVSGSFLIPEPLNAFLERNEFRKAVREIDSQTTSEETFGTRFFRWFDAFRLMKYVHFARDESFGSPGVGEASERLLQLSGHDGRHETNRERLIAYRSIQGESSYIPPGHW